MRLLLTCLVLCCALQLFGQEQETFTHADTLRGSLSPLRTCFDVNYYDLDVQVNLGDSTISGSNLIRFRVVEDMERFQIDLFKNMDIKAIVYHGDNLDYVREGNAVFVNFLRTLKAGTLDSIKVVYSGKPIIAKHAPWDGGFVWAKDKNGDPWVGVACEGIGASLWWPNKDHLSDEPDSMRIHVTVPTGLTDVSNGKLEKVTESEGTTRFDWLVSYPINNYNVTLNIAKYAHFNDWYVSGKDSLALDYYVLPYNLDKAKEQFKQVKPMMACYEKYLGRYPFWRDGYKLVETPYLGMEHQGAIAYGNKYLTGYSGMDFSGIGLSFDYIIIHESGHEWWGNNVTCQDLADMWIHEGFCTYTEAIYVECMFDSATAMKYVNAKKAHVGNKKPIIGHYGVNEEGDGDMYMKGMLMLNTLRFVINNDSLWWSILRGIQRDFALKTTNTNEIVAYISQKAGQDLKPFFDQYLRYPQLPVFEYRLTKAKHHQLHLQYHWVADVPGFNMPLRVTVGKDQYATIQPRTGDMQTMDIHLKKPTDFKIDLDHFYIATKDLGK